MTWGFRSSCSCSSCEVSEVVEEEVRGVVVVVLASSRFEAILFDSSPGSTVVSGLAVTFPLSIGGFEAESEAYRRVNGCGIEGAAARRYCGAGLV